MEIGDYVRTNDGYINKIKKVNQFNVLVDARNLFGEELNISNNEIIKSSPNIIDLIEVGDLMCLNIANKKEAFKDLVVPRIAETENELQRYLDKLNNGEFALKGILTKEQIENGVYWVC